MESQHPGGQLCPAGKQHLQAQRSAHWHAEQLLRLRLAGVSCTKSWNCRGDSDGPICMLEQALCSEIRWWFLPGSVQGGLQRFYEPFEIVCNTVGICEHV